MGMYTFHCFAGAGGGILGDLLLGHTPIGAIEIEKYPQKVLLQRQLDGVLPVFPIWDDVTTFRADNPECAEFIGHLCKISRNLCISGGFPCQDVSVAGPGEGIDGERSGLWGEQARIVREIRPRKVYVENSPALTSRGLGRVLGDLAAMGYDAKWGVLGAGHLGAWHLRERIWVLATDAREDGIQGDGEKPLQREFNIPWEQDVRGLEDLQGRPSIPNALFCRTRNGMAEYVERISAIGNGQVPAVAALAWQILNF